MSLRKAITRTVTSSATTTGVVEDIATIADTQLVSVIINNSNRRMTGLQVVGGQVAVGDTVIIDFTGGAKPYVRPNTQNPNISETAEYEDMNDILQDNSDEVNPDTDGESYLDRILKTATKAKVARLWASQGGTYYPIWNTFITNTMGVSLSNAYGYYGIVANITGIYYISYTVTFGEGCPGIPIVGVYDNNYDYSAWWNGWYHGLFIDKNLEGGGRTINISTVQYAREGDYIYGDMAYNTWMSTQIMSTIVSNPDHSSPVLSVVLLNTSSGIGLNPMPTAG